MFDFGFGELLIVALVALLVLGPERLPRAMRSAGILLRRARASVDSLRAELDRELAAEDLRRQVSELKPPSQVVEEVVDELRRPAKELAEQIRRVGEDRP